MTNGHGGARPGAGRKPKALQYQAEVSDVEQRIVRMLPRLVDKLYEMAMEGDIRATRYLIDRIMGRIPLLEAAPSVDRSMPYSERDYSVENLEHQINLSDDELRLEQRVEDMFVYVGDDDEQTSAEIMPISSDETDNLLRQARMEQEHGTGVNSTSQPTDATDVAATIDPVVIHVPFIPSDGPNDPDRTWYVRDTNPPDTPRAGSQPPHIARQLRPPSGP